MRRSQQNAAFAERIPDAAILGKSPGSRMGYTSANHLLNFQYQVCGLPDTLGQEKAFMLHKSANRFPTGSY